jgi:hypothetical protein
LTPRSGSATVASAGTVSAEPIVWDRPGGSTKGALDSPCLMLVVVHPIVDARAFVPGSTSRLDLPDWPTPPTELNPQFFRCFAPAVRRHRGPDAAWIDERVFCRANRGLRLLNLGRAPLGLESRRQLASLRLTLLNDEVKTLIHQMEERGAGPDQVADAANLLETFTKQATEERPLKEVLLAAGKGLADTAKAVSERVTPIAGAVSAVLKLVGIAVLI